MGEEEEDGKKENWEKKRGWVGKMKKVHHFQANGGGEKVLSSSQIRQIRHTSGCFFFKHPKKLLDKNINNKGVEQSRPWRFLLPYSSRKVVFSFFVEICRRGGEEKKRD